MGPRPHTDDLSARLRELPSVERLAAALAREEGGGPDPTPPDPLIVTVARQVVERRRAELRAGGVTGAGGRDDLLARARDALAAARAPSLRRVINATGVIVHTNLGRAPLADSARAAVGRIAEGYSNLELDLGSGRRGTRQDHIADLACSLTGAEAALAVNNGAGAVLLAAAALAGPGKSLIISRGQLIEIGGSFRVPEVIAVSGSRLVEVGSTNRTRLDDYRRALAAERSAGRVVGAVMRVHPSNFRSLGFVEEVPIEQLCGLDAPVIDDLGSGVIGLGWEPEGGLGPLREEPDARRSVAAGAALVCFSGDKLLGGPQAGLVVGRAEEVIRAASHPLARALRLDKLSLAALEATLALYRDPARARREIPVLAMLDADEGTLQDRAQRLAAGLAAGGLKAQVGRASGRVGGGALPLLELEGPCVKLSAGRLGADGAAAALRGADPAVIARILDGELILDPRTIADSEVDAAWRAAVTALGAG